MRIALLALLAACGSDGPPHWNKQPLEAFDGTIDGQAFTIQLPKGMKKSSVESKYDVEYGYHAEYKGESRTFAPSVSVSKAAKQRSLDEGIAEAKAEIIAKESSAAGWAYAIENDAYKGREDYLVRGQTADGKLDCSARVYPMTKGGKAKDDIPAVMKMCLSLTAK